MNQDRFFQVMKINKLFFIVALISMITNLSIKIINAEESEVIKVGYPIVPGFTEIENSYYTGYAYDYLT